MWGCYTVLYISFILYGCLALYCLILSWNLSQTQVEAETYYTKSCPSPGTVLRRTYAFFERRFNREGDTKIKPKHSMSLHEELELVSSLYDTLNFDSFNLHRISPTAFKESKNVTFIPLWVVGLDNLHMISAHIVVLPKGREIPLHNHPEMIGIIKVIHGKINIKSYSSKGDEVKGVQKTSKPEAKIFTTYSPTSYLTPGKNDFHAIKYEHDEDDNGYAAFLDIQAPASHHALVQFWRHKCKSNNNICVLTQIAYPKSFKSDNRYFSLY